MYIRMCHAMLLCSVLAIASSAETNWPCFRGAAWGVVEDAVLPVSWSTTENVAWKIDVLGRGWSCPIVWGNRVFLTTVASEGHVEEAKKGLYLGGDRNTPSSAVHHWIIYCVDWNTGKTIWQKTVHEGKPAQPVHSKNTYASETSVTDGQRISPLGTSRIWANTLLGTINSVGPTTRRPLPMETISTSSMTVAA